MQDHRNTLLVVSDAEPIGAVPVDVDRLLFQHAALVDRVHMRDQHQLAAAVLGGASLFTVLGVAIPVGLFLEFLL